MSTLSPHRRLTAADILPSASYAAVRVQRRKEIVLKKRDRRLDVGPHVAFYFENAETLWLQIQEMLHIEKGGAEQLAGELEAYNPLIPNGRELVATVMIEIPDERRRRVILATLGGIENTISITFSGHNVPGIPEADQDRTTADGKASAVQFVHFAFTDAQVEAFKTTPAEDILIGFKHPAYTHRAGLTVASKAALVGDFA